MYVLLLLYKLHNCGIRGIIYDWFRRYLFRQTARIQDVLARVVAQAPWSVSSTDLRRDFQ